MLATSLSLSLQEPSVLLIGATLGQARDLAVSSATHKGWRLLSVTPATAVFEQTLEGSGGDDDTGPQRLIRIYARFDEEYGGIRVLLRAEEVEQPGNADEWMADVTARYADNLTNALTSLRASWDAAAPARAPNTGYVTDRGAAPGQVQSPGSSGNPRVGTWAYYAEGYARSRGCDLTDSGAEVEAAGPDWERHRVSCRDGRQIRVYCRYGDCTGVP
ncbi:MAG: hypothetical protein WAM94_02880 [Chromatiaceae bacterium]